MSHKVPEVFYIYQELIAKLALEKKAQQLHYEAKIAELDNEMRILKEKIKAQNILFDQSKEYIHQLENKLLKTKIYQE